MVPQDMTGFQILIFEHVYGLNFHFHQLIDLCGLVSVITTGAVAIPVGLSWLKGWGGCFSNKVWEILLLSSPMAPC